MAERVVVALPRLGCLAGGADALVRRFPVFVRRSVARRGLERADLDPAQELVAEVLVQPESGVVALDHLERDLLDPARARLLVDGVHQGAAEPLPPGLGNDAQPADPATIAAHAEVDQPHRLALVERHEARIEVEIERPLEKAERRLVHLHGYEVALVRTREERRELAPRK